MHLVAQIIRQLFAPPAVAQSYGDSALGILLADNEPVEFGNDFAGGQISHVYPLSSVRRWQPMKRQHTR